VSVTICCDTQFSHADEMLESKLTNSSCQEGFLLNHSLLHCAVGNPCLALVCRWCYNENGGDTGVWLRSFFMSGSR
jgi:hypothetical protein